MTSPRRGRQRQRTDDSSQPTSPDSASAVDQDRSESSESGIELAKTDLQQKLLDAESDDSVWGILRCLTPGSSDVVLLRKGTSKESGQASKEAGYVLGRAPECDVVFDDPHHLTSKRHCLIYQDYRFIEATHRMETNPYIEDMSTNGMTVRDLPLEKNVEYRLQHGDVLKFAGIAREQQNLPDDLAYMFTIPDRVRTNRMSHGLHQRYKMEKSLGSGNFATVKRARDMQTGVFRAITRPKFLENLRTEIAILRTLNHPNIMSLYDAYWESDFVYIVLELVEGGELFDALSKAGRFTEVQAREIMAQLFLALKYLHDRGISHRDLKPENILMVSTDPNDLRIKVSDFGLAKIANASDYMNTLCGTPNYVAPEVLANKQTRKYTCAVDLWSAGVIMYVLLAGYPPFADELGPPEMSEQIRQGKFVFQKQWWGHISGEAKSLIKGLLTVDPSKRLTIDEAMKHPWMQDAFKDAIISEQKYVKHDTQKFPPNHYRRRREKTPPLEGKVNKWNRTKVQAAANVVTPRVARARPPAPPPFADVPSSSTITAPKINPIVSGTSSSTHTSSAATTRHSSTPVPQQQPSARHRDMTPSSRQTPDNTDTTSVPSTRVNSPLSSGGRDPDLIEILTNAIHNDVKSIPTPQGERAESPVRQSKKPRLETVIPPEEVASPVEATPLAPVAVAIADVQVTSTAPHSSAKVDTVPAVIGDRKLSVAEAPVDESRASELAKSPPATPEPVKEASPVSPVKPVSRTPIPRNSTPPRQRRGRAPTPVAASLSITPPLHPRPVPAALSENFPSQEPLFTTSTAPVPQPKPRGLKKDANVTRTPPLNKRKKAEEAVAERPAKKATRPKAGEVVSSSVTTTTTTIQAVVTKNEAVVTAVAPKPVPKTRQRKSAKPVPKPDVTPPVTPALLQTVSSMKGLIEEDGKRRSCRLRKKRS